MKITTKLQNIIMFTKVAALVIVIILGIVALCQGLFQNSSFGLSRHYVDQFNSEEVKGIELNILRIGTLLRLAKNLKVESA